MLSDLVVRNLGVIDSLSLELAPGMTALTGETGAGKTLLVEALQLVLGGRATAGLVRDGTEEALVEARFVVGEGTEDEREVILARSVPVTGRSKAWIDGRMVPIGALEEVAPTLVDIHGQHDHQSLVEPAAQRRALDEFAGIDLALLEQVLGRLRDVGTRMEALGGDDQARARELDIVGHQVAEIEAAAIADVDEEQRLAEEEARLADLAAHREAAAAALALLDGDGDGDTGAAGAVGSAAAALSGRTPFNRFEERLRGVSAELDDLASELRRIVETWEEDPERLDEVQRRRRLLTDLRRKYGADLAEVLEFAEKARTRLDDLRAAEVEGTRLEAERAELEGALDAERAIVRAARRDAAPRFAAAVEARLGDLAMGGARFEVSVADTGAGEPVRFLLGANPGESVQPLARVASGGELARAMLAMRLVAMGGPATMVFDEVDAGVGGAAARALASALAAVGRSRQVLVVTHLAQVAAAADHQISIEKTQAGGRTVTQAAPLGPEERVVEISRMLSGHPDSSTARAHAEELLAVGNSSGESTTSGRARD